MMKKVNPFWLTVCIVSAAAALLLSFIGNEKGILFAKPKKDPQLVAVEFLEALKSGDYEKVNSVLGGWSGFGLETEPETEEGRFMLSLLRNSYDYSLSGDCARKNIIAQQKILFTRLNVEQISAEAASGTEESYLSALNRAAENVENYYTSDILDIYLEYSNGEWKIIPDSALVAALQGGLN